MTLRHMRIFLAVVDSGCNTTRAAEALGMAQPAVSLAIRELETYYGVALFDRIGRRLRITPAGERLREYAARIDTLFEDMEQGMRDWDAFGVLRAGASLTIGSMFLPGYVRDFGAVCPGVQVRALVAPSDELEQKILAGALDIALIEGSVHSGALVSRAYMRDRLTLIASPGSGFAPGQEITREQLAAQRFLLREPGSGTREVFDRAAERAGLSIAPAWEARSTTALINAAAAGLGVAVLPERRVGEAVKSGQVIKIGAQGLDLTRQLYIVYHREKFLTASARRFIALVEEKSPDFDASRG